MFKESPVPEITGSTSTVNEPEASKVSSPLGHPAWEKFYNSEGHQHHLQMLAIKAHISQGAIHAREVQSMAQQGGTVWEKYKQETLRNHEKHSPKD